MATSTDESKQMIQFHTTNLTAVKYEDLIEKQSTIVGEVMYLYEFLNTFPDHEVFMEVVNNHCYRPGYIERYAEVNGRVFVLDDLNDEDAIELMISKDELIKQYQEAFGVNA